jgi:hypothetical protein
MRAIANDSFNLEPAATAGPPRLDVRRFALCAAMSVRSLRAMRAFCLAMMPLMIGDYSSPNCTMRR